MTVAGFLYLACVDKWQVYAKPLAQVTAFSLELAGKNEETDLAGTPEQEDASGTSGSGDGENAEDTQETAESGSSAPADNDSMPEQPVADSEQSGTEPGQQETMPGQPDQETTALGEEAAEPVYVTVEDDYFADAVFIGDSRTVGMYEYGDLENISTFYASTGLTVYKMFDSAIVKVPGQKRKITVEEALQQNSFTKIYLMIGINEMGTGTVETFIEKYKEVLTHLQELQPDAIIYIQAIMKVTTERSEQGDYINNEGIVARNEELEKLADNRKIFYLDVNPLICDETGGMEKSYTFDGVHLKAQYIQIWKDFLKQHAIQ